MFAGKINQKNRVYDLLKAYSYAERREFLVFVGPGKKNFRYKELVQDLLKLKSVEQIDELDWTPVTLKNACAWILVKIIEFEVRNRQDSVYKFAEIDLAIELEAFSHAKKLLLQGFKNA